MFSLFDKRVGRFPITSVIRVVTYALAETNLLFIHFLFSVPATSPLRRMTTWEYECRASKRLPFFKLHSFSYM